MTTLIVQCPNAACGRVSHLGDRSARPDFPMSPLSYKAAKCTGSRSRYAVDGCVGSTTPEFGQFEFQADARHGDGLRQPRPSTHELSARSSSGFESGEVLIGAVDFDCERMTRARTWG